MLEASSFDFRNRHPQQLLIKLAKHFGIERRSDLARTAYQVSLDIYRTFAPLKQTTAALAFACLELAGRLLNSPIEAIESGNEYETWQISRAMVMGTLLHQSPITYLKLTETLLDLLELYTHYRNNTIVGPDFPVEVFLEVRIPLNQEMDAKHLPRFTEWKDQNKKPTVTNGAAAKAPSSSSNGTTKPSPKESPKIASPSTPGLANGASTRGRIGERGRDGTVRFMLNPEREQEERAVVAEYFKPVEEEEIVVDDDHDDHDGRRR
jgi:CTD kinase subunit beta